MTHASESEAREFATAFRSFLDWIYRAQEDRNEVVALVVDYLGEGATEQSVLTRSLPAFEHVNLQAAPAAPVGAGPGRPAERAGARRWPACNSRCFWSRTRTAGTWSWCGPRPSTTTSRGSASRSPACRSMRRRPCTPASRSFEHGAAQQLLDERRRPGAAASPTAVRSSVSRRAPDPRTGTRWSRAGRTRAAGTAGWRPRAKDGT